GPFSTGNSIDNQRNGRPRTHGQLAVLLFSPTGQAVWRTLSRRPQRLREPESASGLPKKGRIISHFSSPRFPGVGMAPRRESQTLAGWPSLLRTMNNLLRTIHLLGPWRRLSIYALPQLAT